MRIKPVMTDVQTTEYTEHTEKDREAPSFGIFRRLKFDLHFRVFRVFRGSMKKSSIISFQIPAPRRGVFISESKSCHKQPYRRWMPMIPV